MDVGALRHLVTIDNPGTPVPDGEGGFTTAWEALTSAPIQAAIQPASARDLERVVSGTVQSTASHLVTIRYRAGITTQSRITKGPRNADGSLPTGSREFHIVGIQNPHEMNRELVLACVEQVV